jgi:hypothetical protein
MTPSVWATGFTPEHRLDRKTLNCGPGSKQCGNACIPKDRKCRASWNKPVKAAAAIGGLAAAGLVGTALFHPRTNMRNAARGMIEPVMQGGFAAGNAARGNWGGAAKNMANAGLAAEGFGRNARTVASGYGTDIRNAKNRAKTAYFRWRNHRPTA